ncbi:hypothetical protein Leryth_017739 [Lithospermum erythrorhizon]|nr:hypothetical protein Leryth_017739 [Lithospermum erythrorhizon]
MEDHLHHHLPDFQRLTHLELTMEFEGHAVSKLMKFLQCLPKLESVCFCEGLKPQLRQNSDAKIHESVPHCFLPSLRTVTLQNCRGSEVEMQFLLIFLGHGSLLEKMNVVWSRSSSRDPNKETKFQDQLQALKGCMQCVLVFVNHQ